MTDLIQLKEASYKGVSFLAVTMPTTGGRRVIQYRFPRSDKQAIEDQGKLPRQFTLNAVISNENYFSQKAALIRVLEDGNKGTLVHPTFGNVENVRSGTYTITEKISETGKAQITMEFFIEESQGIPVALQVTPSVVKNASDAFNLSLIDDIVAAYKVTSNFVGNFQAAVNNALNVADAFVASITKISPLNQAINDFNAVITGFRTNVNTLVFDARSMGNNISNIFVEFGNLYNLPGEELLVISELFNFGANDPIIEQNTAGRIERKQNQDVMRANIKTQSLSYAYLAAVQVDYTNENDLNAANNALEAQYLDVRQNEMLSNESLLLLDALRVNANAVLSEILLNTRKVITINTRRMPIQRLVYSYYGSTDLVETIADLNDIQQRAFVEGDVLVLSE